jgi:hypothetical protein
MQIETTEQAKECVKNPYNGKHCWSATTSEFRSFGKDLDGKVDGAYFLKRYCVYCEEVRWV